ncbi:hypothetical protein [Helicovermis profundi]|uniref:Uncharacterized protein n=1 Tax=Helicovermis profundi TaxID=3065157 RepID=A0AAU9E409_9FIRM|nr:hypothetical protein HLPR_10260 [Clostridia bacterium S502]
METTYSISENFIKLKKRTMLTLTIMMPILIMLSAVIGFGNSTIIKSSKFILILSGISIFLVIELIVVSKIMLKKIKSNKIEFTDTAIKRYGGKYVEEFNFEDITKIKVIKLPSKKIEYIKIKYKKKSITLYGFENLEDIFKKIENKIPDTSIITDKFWKINWNNPFAMIVFMLLLLVVISSITRINHTLYEYFNNVFTIGVSLYFILGKPISKSGGKRFRILELILGCAILISSLIGISSLFFN